MSDDVLDALLALHDGDDRCGCLRHCIRLIDDGQRGEVVEALLNCLHHHPAGSIYRANR